MNLRRFIPKFSLRTLAVFTLLCTSGYALWLHWEAWYCEHVLKGHETLVISAAFSPGGERVVTASRDKTARIWLRRRPEWWWGLLYLSEFWGTALFGALFIWSVWRDRKSLASHD